MEDAEKHQEDRRLAENYKNDDNKNERNCLRHAVI